MHCSIVVALALYSAPASALAVRARGIAVMPSLLSLRGGGNSGIAKESRHQQAAELVAAAKGQDAATNRQNRGEPPFLSIKFVLSTLAYAVVPTFLRILYALVVRARAPLPVPIEPSLLQSFGVVAAPPPVVRAALPFPETWQVLLAAAWFGNMVSVMVPGRYDGASAMKSEKPSAETANLFTPAGYAFIIWAPIFFGELLMMLYLTNIKSAAALGRAAAPGWCAGTLAQILWCGAFRPTVCGPQLLWLPAALLAITGAFLGVSHRAIRASSYGIFGNLLVRVPVTLHFGWITAASLVNLKCALAGIECQIYI